MAATVGLIFLVANMIDHVQFLSIEKFHFLHFGDTLSQLATVAGGAVAAFKALDYMQNYAFSSRCSKLAASETGLHEGDLVILAGHFGTGEVVVVRNSLVVVIVVGII